VFYLNYAALPRVRSPPPSLPLPPPPVLPPRRAANAASEEIPRERERRRCSERSEIFIKPSRVSLRPARVSDIRRRGSRGTNARDCRYRPPVASLCNRSPAAGSDGSSDSRGVEEVGRRGREIGSPSSVARGAARVIFHHRRITATAWRSNANVTTCSLPIINLARRDNNAVGLHDGALITESGAPRSWRSRVTRRGADRLWFCRQRRLFRQSVL